MTGAGSTRPRIGVVSGTRAEYGLLRPLLARLRDDPDVELVVYLTGMHLSAEFGSTEAEVVADGFEPIRVEMLLSSDTPVGTTKSIGLGTIGFADTYAATAPNLLIGLGDRFELLAAVTAALVQQIPVAHIHGGEVTEGAVDDAIRHAVTKMSHLHFTATAEYRRRVIQMGEDPDRVFNVGSLAVENARSVDLLPLDALAAELGIEIARPFLVVTFHPVTLEAGQASAQAGVLLDALDTIHGASIVITYPNADAEGRSIVPLLEGFAARRPTHRAVRPSLGQRRYLRCLAHADAVVGNSSSGLLEAPLFGTPTVDVGDRQRGRIRPLSVVHAEPDAGAIQAALEKALSPGFRRSIEGLAHPYGDGTTSARIHGIVKERLSMGISTKKSFHDLNIATMNRPGFAGGRFV